MRKLARCAVLTALACLTLTAPALAHHPRPHHHHHATHHATPHHPGCRSSTCDHRVDVIWGRHHRVAARMQRATASWFSDAGLTACQAAGGGTLHLAHGYAHLPGAGWDCGTRVLFYYQGRSVVGEREDSGPYVEGRLFDLTPGLKAALGCSDLCHLHWRRL